MSEGAYFVVGGIKGGKKFRKLFPRLLDLKGQDDPHILYFGAACRNKTEYKIKFEQGCARDLPASHVSSVNLYFNMTVSERYRAEEKLVRRFAEADVVYFDGGSVRVLKGGL